MDQLSAAPLGLREQDWYLINTSNNLCQLLQEESQQPLQTQLDPWQRNSSLVPLPKPASRNLSNQQRNTDGSIILENRSLQSLEPLGQYATKIEPSQSSAGVLHPLELTIAPQAYVHTDPNTFHFFEAEHIGAEIVPLCSRECTELEKIMSIDYMAHQQSINDSPNQTIFSYQLLTTNLSTHPAVSPALGKGEFTTWATSQQNDSSAIIRSIQTPAVQKFPYSNRLTGEQLGRSSGQQSLNSSFESDQWLQRMDRIAGTTTPTGPSCKVAPRASALVSQKHARMHCETSLNMHTQDLVPRLAAQAHFSTSSLGIAGDPIDLKYRSYAVNLPPSPREMPIRDLGSSATVDSTADLAKAIQACMSRSDTQPRKWACLYPNCGKTFRRKEHTQAHVQVHLGRRLFRCIRCKKYFARREDLKRHSRTHLEEKPFACSCGKTFTRSDTLKVHLRKGNCNKGFEAVFQKPAKRGRPRKIRQSYDH